MRFRQLCVGLAAASLLGFAHGQQPSRVAAEGISDVGTFEQVPYQLEPQMSLRTNEKTALRKLEDKHIAELRAIEDRYEQDLRALRAKQQAEREVLFKSFAARR